MIRHCLKIIALILFVASSGCNTQAQEDGNKDFVNWAKNNAHEIKSLTLQEDQTDLFPLTEIVGNARLVCLGESRHDIREQFLLKHRFIKYLVEEMRFTTFILEGSLPYAHLLNDYLLKGEGNLDDLMAQMPGWFIWDTDELKATIQWMRSYNERSENAAKIQFYGMDIVAPNYGLEQVFEYLEKVDPEYVTQLGQTDFGRESFVDSFWPQSLERYAVLSEGTQSLISANYESLYQHITSNKNTYIAQSSDSAYSYMLRLISCAREANSMFSANSRLEMGLIRDRAMADHVMWILDEVAPQQKAIIWAHNVHIAKSTFTMTGEEGIIEGMGAILAQHLQEDMITLGASFNQGTFEAQQRTFAPAPANTIDGALVQVNKEAFLLNLNALSDQDKATRWVAEE